MRDGGCKPQRLGKSDGAGDERVLDPAVLKIIRALARNAARRDHLRDTTEANDGKSSNLRPILD